MKKEQSLDYQGLLLFSVKNMVSQRWRPLTDHRWIPIVVTRYFYMQNCKVGGVFRV